jgi:hypothetical protein
LRQYTTDADDVMCLVRLPGLCSWVAEGQLWEDEDVVEEFGQDAADAAKAVALGVPRPGHSMLGRCLHSFTFRQNGCTLAGWRKENGSC